MILARFGKRHRGFQDSPDRTAQTRRACITHAGINTTFESLSLGVPMVAIPVGRDQPGIAARSVYHGVGESVPVASMNKEDLSGAIQEVLGNPSYRDTARRFQRTIAQTHRLDRAADVLERAFQLVDEPVSHDGGAFNLPLTVTDSRQLPGLLTP